MRLPWESVLDLAEPIIEAIEYLHAREIIHGQLQPDKIMISGLSPVLIDVRADRAGSPFRSGHPLTIPELSLRPPELFSDPERLSFRSDLYSCGAIAYLAITGRSPIDGETIQQITTNVREQTPEPVASIVMDCPVWLDKLISQLLSKNPADRPFSALAVRLALAEVRRRAMSRSGVAEHTSAGFSPLNVTDQKDRDEARSLLGKAALESDRAVPDGTPWHDKPWILIAALAVLLVGFTYILWPLNEDQLRSRAEALLVEETRNSLNQAKTSYLEPMLTRFPDGRHNHWAREQIDRVEMLQAEHALSVKLKRNLPLSDEGERLYAEASEFERFGDVTTALDRYRSMETLLGDDPKYRPFVNLARRQIAEIARDDRGGGEAAAIIEQKLAEADELWQAGKVVAARQIWYSVIELYGNNDNVTPWVSRAQDRLADSKGPRGSNQRAVRDDE